MICIFKNFKIKSFKINRIIIHTLMRYIIINSIFFYHCYIMHIQTIIIRIYLCHNLLIRKISLCFANHLYINIISYCKYNFLFNYY